MEPGGGTSQIKVNQTRLSENTGHPLDTIIFAEPVCTFMSAEAESETAKI